MFSDLNGYDRLLIVNGCKPEWLPDWIHADMIFRDACNQHDVDYFAGGCEKNRKEADENFLKKMKDIIKSKKYGWWKRWKMNRVAKAYYKLVRQFGDTVFQYRYKLVDGKKEAMILTKKDLPSYSPQVDYRFIDGCYKGIIAVRRNSRWYLKGEVL